MNTTTARPIAAPSVLACAGDLEMGLVTLPSHTSASEASAHFARIVHHAQPQTRIYARLVGPFLQASVHGRSTALAQQQFRTQALVRKCAVALNSGPA